MSQFIKHLKAVGIHGRFDIDISFQDGINIIHGSNGTGKTTLLHILANAVNQDFRRFAYLKFQELKIILDDDTIIQLKRNTHNSELKAEIIISINEVQVQSYSLEELFKEERQKIDRHYSLSHYEKSSLIDLKATYFPAFRTMIEAWATLDENEIRYFANRTPRFRRFLKSSAKSTELARILFGKFVPEIEYPSPIEIEESINSEVIDAQLKIASIDRSLLSDAFFETFEAIFLSSEDQDNMEEAQKIIQDIEKISEKLENHSFQTDHFVSENVYKKLRELLSQTGIDSENSVAKKRLLSVYRSSFQKRLDEQTKAYSSIETYLESVNEFLEKKKLEIQITSSRLSTRSRLSVKIGDEDSVNNLRILSSGERQIVGLIYAASHMTDNKVVLIDEPEISLHLDWQRKLLPEMLKQLAEKQIIICTHSPTIASKYRDRMIELELKPTQNTDIDERHDELYDELEDIIPF